MHSYFASFPEKSQTELRTVTFLGKGHDDRIPPGTYVFNEYFCTDCECDCQQVIIKVLRTTSPRDAEAEDVATIGYTWNEENARQVWGELVEGVANPHLEPLYFQAGYAHALMSFWEKMVNADRAYALRLERHYAELRAACAQPTPATRDASVLTRRDKWGRQRKLEQFKRQRKSR